jgi:branched-subunit amino acid aminotransferase/4-amino-4-deoxychorismate lyase
VPVSICRNSSSPLSRIKSLNFLDNILAKQQAKQLGAQEGLMLNERGDVAECTLSNLFLVNSSGDLITPHIETGVLNGITRQIVLDLARQLSIPCVERSVKTHELDTCIELFCTSSLIEIMPITKWQNQTIGNGKIGCLTEKLLSAYREKIISSRSTYRL